ncbi:MAG: alpha/beta-type small acid-soluble spore protein [Tumebacillaceae bacterium]
MATRKKWDVNDPEIRRMVEQVKWEIAAEYGIQMPRDGYYGHIVSKDLGKIGSQLQKRIPMLIEWQEKQRIAPTQKTKKQSDSKKKRQ